MSEATTKPAETNGTALAKAPIAVGERGLQLTGLDEIWRFAGYVAAVPGFAPKGLDTQTAITVAIHYGLEIGLSPMQSLQSLAVINGKPSIYGDAGKALVESSGLMEEYRQWYEIGGNKLVTSEGHPRTPTAAEMKNDELMACVLSKRKGRAEPLVHTFSIGDAKTAGLLGKTGPWQNYPSRMMMWRARGFNLRDNFGDVLKGLYLAEESEDMPAATQLSTAVKKTPESIVEGLKNRLSNGTPDAEFASAPETPPVEAKAADPKPADALTAAIDSFKDAGGIPEELAEANKTTLAKVRKSTGKERELHASLFSMEAEALVKAAAK